MLLSACAPAVTPAPAEPTKAAAPAEPTKAAAPAEPTATQAQAAEPTKAAEVPAASKPSGKLLIWVQKANQDVFEKTALADFQKEFPDIQLEWVNYPPSEVANQMAIAIQGGSGGPDLGITDDGSMPKLIELGGLMDITQKVDPYQAQLTPSLLKASIKDGKTYGVPWDVGPVVTFYRRDIFKAAGLSDKPEDVSAMVATWDKYLQTCMTIKEKTGLKCFAENKANNYGTLFNIVLWQQGLNLWSDDGKVLVDGPQYADTLTKLGEFAKNDLVSDELNWTDNWYAVLKANMDDKTVKPVATLVEAAWMGNFLKTWIAPDQKGNWGVAQMPSFAEGGVRSSNDGGSSYFIPAKSTNPEAAWAFIEFMNLRKANHVSIFKYSDYFPAFTATYDDPLFQEPDDYFGGEVTRTMYAEVANQIPTVNMYGPYSGTFNSAIGTAIQKFYMGQLSAADALKEAADSIRTETGLQ
jgi:ABC-type glycerol-3-phosphate transport system substrate-binding protein